MSPGQVLAEVETDKATIDWEAQEDGFIAKLLVPDDTKDIPLGTAVAVLVEEQSDVAAFKNFTVGGALRFHHAHGSAACMTHACMEQVRVHGAPCDPGVFAWCLTVLQHQAAPHRLLQRRRPHLLRHPLRARVATSRLTRCEEPHHFPYLEQRHAAPAIHSMIGRASGHCRCWTCPRCHLP